MAITFPLDLKSETPSARTFDLVYDPGVSVTQSPFSTEVQTFQHDRLHWSAAVTLPPMKNNPDGRRWHSHFINLNGRAKTFYYTVPDHATPSGTERNNFQTTGTMAKGATSITVQFMTNNATLLAGDLCTIGHRLYMIAEDMTANGSGAGTITLTHGLRALQPGVTGVTVLNPYGKWRLIGDSFANATDQSNISTIAFSMEEAI
jgi:hypothetical protein